MKRKPRVIRYENLGIVAAQIRCQGGCGRIIEGPVIEALMNTGESRAKPIYMCEECAGEKAGGTTEERA